MHRRRSIRTSEGGLDVHHLCRKRDQYAHEGRTERSLEARCTKVVCKRSSICALVVQRTGIRVAQDVNESALNGHQNSSAPVALDMNSGDTLQDQLMYTAENSVPSLKDPRCTPKAHQLHPKKALNEYQEHTKYTPEVPPEAL